YRVGSPEMAPNPPGARSAPAKPWRSSVALRSAQRQLALEHGEGRAARGVERLANLRLPAPRPLPQQHLEERGVEGVGLADHGQARARSARRHLDPVLERRAPARPEPRVEGFAREIEGDLATD